MCFDVLMDRFEWNARLCTEIGTAPEVDNKTTRFGGYTVYLGQTRENGGK